MCTCTMCVCVQVCVRVASEVSVSTAQSPCSWGTAEACMLPSGPTCPLAGAVLPTGAVSEV